MCSNIPATKICGTPKKKKKRHGQVVAKKKFALYDCNSCIEWQMNNHLYEFQTDIYMCNATMQY